MSDQHRYLAVRIAGVEIDVSFENYTVNGQKHRYAAVIVRGRQGAFTFDRAFAEDIAPEFAELVPEGFSLQLHNAFFATVRPPNPEQAKRILGVDFGLAVDLANLPLVGKAFAGLGRVSLDRFGIVFSKHALNQAEYDNLRRIIPPDAMRFPPAVTAGARFSTTLLLGDEPFDISLEAANPPPGVPDLPQPSVQRLEPPGTAWFPVDKSFGPVSLVRVGARYRPGSRELCLLLDATLALGPVTFALAGLSVVTPVAELAPRFELQGLGLSFARGPIQISGAFLYDREDSSCSGTAAIQTPSLALSALGAFKSLDGRSSLFVYATLNLVSGVGPVFFQVKGLAAGFGYDREVRVPDVTGIATFPLVSMAVNPPAEQPDPMQLLRATKDYFPATRGALFLALGVKFDSFKLIDGFALLIARFGPGDKLAFDVLGLATLRVPTSTGQGASRPTPLAQVQLALRATCDVTAGSLLAVGVLTPDSFILSRDCRLTGGYAFASWLAGAHAGDFVYTMGGYHPRFPVPTHYPRVPRLGFHWQLTRELGIKGEMYYALTPSALMAGGRLEALFQFERTVSFDIGIAGASLTGGIKAWFIIGADFIISWQPYYYDAHVYLQVGIGVVFRGSAYFRVGFFEVSKSVEKRFDVSLGANLHIWGPEFAGIAHVDWSIISFDVAFGSRERTQPAALSWPQFKQAFLPAGEDICSVDVVGGTTRQLDDGTWIVNPAELVLTTQAVIPSTKIKLDGETSSLITGKDFAIGCMKVPKQVVSGEETQPGIVSTHTITIDGPMDAADFAFAALEKNGPEALWGERFTANLDDLAASSGIIEDLLMGVRIEPGPKQEPEQTEDRAVSDFHYDVAPRADAFRWTTALATTPGVGEGEDSKAILLGIADRAEQRDPLLEALGLDSRGVDLSGLGAGSEAAFDEAFLAVPRVVTLT
ncbi:MAG: hypothetical protein QNK37_17800 [Acidobacteriota bacterium]|nr:hypothetical protein [Acidobacteriota bacterium]